MTLEKISLLKQQLYLVNCTRMVTNGNLMPLEAVIRVAWLLCATVMV